MESITKFPRTPHLAGSHLTDNEDRVLSQEATEEVLQRPLLLQEKLDGANIGVSFEEGKLMLQSRGTYLTGGNHPQFDFFKKWAYDHYGELFHLVEGDFIAYGELLFVKHTIVYDALPSYVVFFDLLEKSTGEFYSLPRLEERVAKSFGEEAVLTITPPVISHRVVLKTLEALFDQIGKSAYGEETMEGIYLRWEDDDKLLGRYKYVRPSFQEAIKGRDQAFKREFVRNTLKHA